MPKTIKDIFMGWKHMKVIDYLGENIDYHSRMKRLLKIDYRYLHKILDDFVHYNLVEKKKNGNKVMYLITGKGKEVVKILNPIKKYL